MQVRGQLMTASAPRLMPKHVHRRIQTHGAPSDRLCDTEKGFDQDMCHHLTSPLTSRPKHHSSICPDTHASKVGWKLNRPYANAATNRNSLWRTVRWVVHASGWTGKVTKAYGQLCTVTVSGESDSLQEGLPWGQPQPCKLINMKWQKRPHDAHGWCSA